MSTPVSGNAATAAYDDAYSEWLQTFPTSVPNSRFDNQDGVELSEDNGVYQCGQDAEIDRHVCVGGVRKDGAGIIEIRDASSPAEAARRSGQSYGFTRETFTTWWIIDRYTSKGQPAPTITPALQRVIDRDFLQRQQADSVTTLRAWERYDHSARAGNMIAAGTLTAIASFPVFNLVIDNPALLVKAIAAAKTAPMLTSSGGPDGGMGTVVEVGAGLAVSPGRGAAKEAAQTATQTARLTAQQAAALEMRVVGGPAKTAMTRSTAPASDAAGASGAAGTAAANAASTAVKSRLLEAGPALEAPRVPRLLEAGSPPSAGRQLREAYKTHKDAIDYPHIEGHVQVANNGNISVKGGHFPTHPRLQLDGEMTVAYNRVMKGGVRVDGLAKTNNGGQSTVAPEYLTHAQSEAELAFALGNRQQVGTQWFGTSLDGTTWKLFPPTPNVPKWRGYPLFEEQAGPTRLTPLTGEIAAGH